MSRGFRESNEESTAKLYYKNIMYRSLHPEPRAASNDHIMNFNLAEKIMFGRVDSNNLPITLNPRYLRTSRYSAEETPIKVVNFVSVKFEELVMHFRLAATKGQIDGNDPYLGAPMAYKGYQSPWMRYNDYRNSWYSVLANNYRENEHKILDFDILTQSLKETLIYQDKLRRHPWTFSAFVKSRLCPIACSGLAIEIADSRLFACSNDAKKVAKFFASPNWDFYVNACNNYGFMIDENAPWRIVADLDSVAMREACASVNNGLRGAQSVLRTMYQLAYPAAFNKFDSDLLELYNLSRDEAYAGPSTCPTSHAAIKVMRSAVYSLQTLRDKFSDEFFIELYLMFRFAEEESLFSEAERELMINRVIDLFYADRLDVGLFEFERVLNKTFDYVGSLTYNIKANQIQNEKASNEAQLTAPFFVPGSDNKFPVKIDE